MQLFKQICIYISLKNIYTDVKKTEIYLMYNKLLKLLKLVISNNITYEYYLKPLEYLSH